MITKPKVLIHVPIEDKLIKKIQKVAEIDELIITAPREELLAKIQILQSETKSPSDTRPSEE